MVCGLSRPAQPDDRATARQVPASQPAIFSAITIVVRLVFAAGMAGITDASATHSPSAPCTAPRVPTTAPWSGSGPMAQVPTGWW
jgi:hypothetical protein